MTCVRGSCTLEGIWLETIAQKRTDSLSNESSISSGRGYEIRKQGNGRNCVVLELNLIDTVVHAGCLFLKRPSHTNGMELAQFITKNIAKNVPASVTFSDARITSQNVRGPYQQKA